MSTWMKFLKDDDSGPPDGRAKKGDVQELDDRTIRRVMNHAIARRATDEEIVQAGGPAQPVSGINPPGAATPEKKAT